MRPRHVLLPCLLAAGGLAACGSAGAPPATAPRDAVAGGALPGGADLARRLAVAYRPALRRLAVATGAAGETGDIGQPVVTGVVDRVRCDTRRRCVVRWLDAEGERHRVGYVVGRAPRACFVATASPALPPIRDVPSNATAVHPLQEVEGAPRC